MKSITSTVYFAALIVVLSMSAPAQELIVNGGFDVFGNYVPGWNMTQNGVDGTLIDGSGRYTGQPGRNSSAAFLLDNCNISQTFNSVPGQTYLVSFWLANGGGIFQRTIDVSFADAPMLSHTFSNDGLGFVYGYYEFTALAHELNTTLMFSVTNADAYTKIYLDDVSVIPNVSPDTRPVLNISPSNGQMLLTWSSPTAGWNLESNTTLAGEWSTVTNTPTVSGDQYTVILSSADANRFYRLRQ